jgi:predicted nucleotidyltransferase
MDLEPLRDALEAQPAVRLAVVFGSAARGRERAKSDLDLALRLEPSTAATRREALAAAGRAARRDIHLVELDETPPLLGFQIARDGVLLVEREPWAWARFKAHAMVEWWEWAPSARKIEAAYIQRLRRDVAHGGS